MAAVIFVDVVAYSRKPNVEQREISQEINERCAHFLHQEFRHQRLTRESSESLMVAAMPTGDGMVVCLEKTPRPNLDTGHVLLLLAFYLSRWARKRNVSLRIGLHSGELNVIEDINGNSNFCGHAINQTQRIMDLGTQDGHILCSSDFFQSYLSSPTGMELLGKHIGTFIETQGIVSYLPKNLYTEPLFETIRRTSCRIEVTPDAKDFSVKHNYQIRVHNIMLVAETVLPGSRPGDEPMRSVIAGYEVPPNPRVSHEILDSKVMEGELGLMLRAVLSNHCENIVVIGSINERFGYHLEAELRKSGVKGLHRIDVCFCNQDSLERMNRLQDIDEPHIKVEEIRTERIRRDMVELRARSVEKLKSLSAQLTAQYPHFEMRLLEYPFMPCAGLIAGYKKRENPPEIIQVNRYVWGQKSLWSSIQVLNRQQQGEEYDEYSKYNRYIEFTLFNCNEIHVSEPGEIQAIAEPSSSGRARTRTARPRG